ncbi:MAG: hypothetical protein V4735_07030 [Pseudomonadota bacterium]
MKQDSTTTYRWGAGSAIAQVDVRAQHNGHAVAYVYADPKVAPETLQTIRAAIRLKGWGTLSDHRNDRFGLRVSGLKDGHELIELLSHQDGIGKPTQEATTADAVEKPKTFIENVKAHSLRGAGIFYSMGNVVYLMSGVLRSREQGKIDHGQIGSSLIWGAGDALVAAIGGRDDSRQLTSLLTKLRNHYDNEGIEIPQNSAIHVETSTKGKTLGNRTYDFLHEYLNPIKCGTEVAAAFGYFNAGKNQGNVWKQRTAVTFGLGFGASLLIKEKKIDADKYEQAGPLGKLWMKIQSNPLSVGGISGYSNTILTTVGALDEGRRFRDPAKYPTLANAQGKIIAPSKYYKLDFAAPAVMFFGNSLYAISKKNTGGDIKAQAMVSDVYSVAAQIINKQPEATREASMESTARFLGERPEIKDTHQEIIARLKAEIAIQRQNPWFENLVLHKPAGKARGTHKEAETAPASQVQRESVQHQAKGVAANDAPYLETANGR